eukprot:jgi/Chlat1/6844/Chrsp51S06530
MSAADFFSTLKSAAASWTRGGGASRVTPSEQLPRQAEHSSSEVPGFSASASAPASAASAASAGSAAQQQQQQRKSAAKLPSAKIHVSHSKGTFAHVEADFHVALDKDKVFEILVDPNNRQVFKNIVGVKYRRLLEKKGPDHEVYEISQVARWKFLVFSGTFDVKLLVDQDKTNYTLKFWLQQAGFMNKFNGSWSISDVPGYDRSVSQVLLEQSLQPALVPPPPLDGYVRSITAKVTKELIQDFQKEARKLSGLPEPPVEEVSSRERSNSWREQKQQSRRDEQQQSGVSSNGGDAEHKTPGDERERRRASSRTFRRRLQHGGDDEVFDSSQFDSRG